MEKNNSLNLFRLLFATFVIIIHFGIYNYNYGNLFPKPLVIFFGLAVPMFFVVSGYLITPSALKHNLKGYLARRFGRIYPAYFFALIAVPVIFAPITYLLQHKGSLSGYLAQTPSPLHYFIFGLPLDVLSPRIGTMKDILLPEGWNGSIWTIIFEFGCYLAIFAVIALFRRTRLKEINYKWAILLLWGVVLLLSIIFPTQEKPASFVSYLVTYSFYLAGIWLGGALYYFFQDKFSLTWVNALLSFVVCALAIPLFPHHFGIQLTSPFLTYVLIFLSKKIPSPKWIKENDLSYGVYLYAWPTGVVVSMIFRSSLHLDNILLYFMTTLLVSLIFAWISWVVIEKRVLTMVRR